jgi:hypothetical protein
MKTTLISAALLTALSASSAFAAQENTGCGLGSMVFDGQSGVGPQVLAVTTNGTSGNQTFGISSGTLGCTQDGVVQSTQKLSMFTGSNMDKLARDMSVGHGESLETIAELMGIAEEDKSSFFAVSQQNFDKIFSSEDVTAEQVLASLNEVMAQDEKLARYTA